MNAEELKKLYEPKEARQIQIDRQVHAASFSPCGKLLCAGGFEGEVCRWDMSGEEPAELPRVNGHAAWVQAIAFRPQGDLLFSADSWGQLRAWPYADNEPQMKWSVPQAHDGWIRDIAVSPDGQLVATCGLDQKIKLWSAEDGSLEKELAGYGQDIYRVLFAPDGKSLLSGDDRGIVKQWSLETGEVSRQFDASVLYVLHRLQDVGGVRTMNFDAEGKTLAVGGTKPKNGATVQGVPTLLLFDFASGDLLHTLEFGAANHCYVENVSLHASGFVMALTNGTPGTSQFLFQRPTDEKPFFVHTQLANCHSLSVHPSGRRLAVTTTNRGSNGNGRRLNKDGEYEGNTSPIYLFDLPDAAENG